MDSQAAAEFARMRSKDRALIEPARPQQRRRSHHNLQLDTGEAKTSRRRPQHSLHDIPPVPAIDASKLKAPRSAKPRLESGDQEKITASSQNAYSHTKVQVVTHVVEEHKQHGQSLAQQHVDWEASSRHWNQR